MKRLNMVLIMGLAFMLVPLQALASGQSDQYYPPSNSDYYQKKIAWQIYISNGISKVRLTQYKPGLPQARENIITQVVWNVKPNSYMWVDMQCKGTLSFEYLDDNNKVIQIETRGETTTYLNEGSCAAGDAVKPSEYNQEKKQFKSDTFGGTKPKLTSPATADGSGGTGSTGYLGVGSDGSPPPEPDPDPEPEPDPGGGGTDPGETEPEYDYPEWCDPECRVFECPQWKQYMGKIDDIRNAIPPPPNWPVVADTFRDSIVPKLVNDLGNLLGTAPEPPSVPSQLPPLDDRGIRGKEPEMNDVPGLKDSGFSSDKIKNEAPVIPEREDPTGGFDLIQNPMDTLPDAPDNPKPGATNAGEWGQNKPKEEANPFPFPQDTGEPQVGTPPKPGDNGATPPSPGGDPGSAPTPGGDLGNGPTPGGSGGGPNMKDYKPSPDAEDGSGSVIYP